MVTCDARHQSISAADTVIETPRLIVEILSTSTDATDRREKLLAYRSLPSLLEYVLISQKEASVEIHRRQGDIGWQIITLSPGDPVELSSVEILTDFAAVYEESGLEL
jgi:Uma2 family endonuclease